jgi:hypothetical protein
LSDSGEGINEDQAGLGVFVEPSAELIAKDAADGAMAGS